MANLGWNTGYIGTRSGYSNYYKNLLAKQSGINDWNEFLKSGINTETRQLSEGLKYDMSKIYSGYMSNNNMLEESGYTNNSIFGRNIKDIYNANIAGEKSKFGESVVNIYDKYNKIDDSLTEQANVFADTTKDLTKSAYEYLSTITEGELYDSYTSVLQPLADEMGTTDLSKALVKSGFTEIDKNGNYSSTATGTKLLSDVLNNAGFQDYIRNTNEKLYNKVGDNWNTIYKSLFDDKTIEDITRDRDMLITSRTDEYVSDNNLYTKINNIDDVKTNMFTSRLTVKDYKNRDVDIQYLNNNELPSGIDKYYKSNGFENGDVFTYKNKKYVKKGKKYWSIV